MSVSLPTRGRIASHPSSLPAAKCSLTHICFAFFPFGRPLYSTRLVRCSDTKTYFYTVDECVAGKYGHDRSNFTCADDYPDFPYCESCGSFTLCAKDQSSCTELGLQALVDAPPGTPMQYPIMTPPTDTEVECRADGAATVNFNFFIRNPALMRRMFK